MAATAPTSWVIIRELTGDNREVTLYGGGLPLQGANWGGEQRVVTTWYPGNATQATQQVLGPIEADTDWEGMWRTTRLIRTPAKYVDKNGTAFITEAKTLADVLDDVFRTGQTLHVEWVDNTRGLGRSVVREGMAKTWDFAFDRADDIKWKVTWNWSGRGGKQQKAVAFRTENVLAVIRSMTLDAQEWTQWQERDAEIANRKKGSKFTTQFSLGQLENLANGPYEFARSITRKMQQIAHTFKQLGDLIVKVRSIPYQLTNLGLDLATNTIAISNQFIDEMSRKPPEALSAKTKLSNLTNAASYYSTGVTQAQLARRTAQQMKTQLQAQGKSQSTVLGVHIVRDQTESFVTMSKRYYQTPDFGPGIARANGLPLSQQFAERGDVLIIPTVDVIKGFHLTNG